MNGGRLSESEVRQLARDLFAGQRARTERQARPVAVLMAGQSGAGKSTIASEIRDQLATRGGSVLVDADAVRPALPYFADLDPRTENVATSTQVDAGRVAQALAKEAAAAGRNVVIVGTLRSPDLALASAQALRDQGYQVELHAVAVHELISQLRATLREEGEVSRGVIARNVPPQWEADSFAGAGASVRKLEQAGAVDRVVVYNRLGDAVVDTTPVAGQARAADAFDQARTQLTNYERISLARDWDEVMESMAKRGASRETQALAGERAERAHYTLRCSPSASAAYDDAEPSSTHASKEAAERYGARLAAAYKANDHGQAARHPELVSAFAATAAASKLVQAQGQPPAALEAVRKRVESALQRGEPLAAPKLRLHERPPQEAFQGR